MKAAVTLDGNMALSSGESKWITNGMSRARSHMLRDRHDAVMVGSGTVLRDDPALTVRSVSGRDPVAVVLDPMLRVPEDARIVREGSIFFISPNAPEKKRQILENKGCRVFESKMTDEHRLSLIDSLERLALEGINDLLLECGSALLGSFIRERLFDSVSLFFSTGFAGAGKGMGDGFTIDNIPYHRRQFSVCRKSGWRHLA